MALITRRQFVRQAAFAAAFNGCPVRSIGEARRLFNTDEQKVAPLDAETIRKLRSGIVGNVITPDSSEYEAARVVFNRAFDRRPAVIVRCAGSSDVARALDFAQTKNSPLAVHGGGHSRLGYGVCNGGGSTSPQ
jgi:FAD/FMN-containing dehydrogenase